MPNDSAAKVVKTPATQASDPSMANGSAEGKKAEGTVRKEESTFKKEEGAVKNEAGLKSEGKGVDADKAKIEEGQGFDGRFVFIA